MYSKAPVTAENGQCLPEICPMSYALNYISSICRLVDYSYVQFQVVCSVEPDLRSKRKRS
jgi:hypothetical protein